MNNNSISHSERRAFKELSNGSENKFIKTMLNSQFVDIRKSDENGNSFLLVAIANERKNAADFLSNDPTLINFKGKNGTPPSFGFSRNIDSHFLDFLIKKGMDINAKDNFGNNMLHNLHKFGSKEDYVACLHLGADIHAVNSEGKTPFDLAERFGKKDLFIQACNEYQSNIGNFVPKPKDDTVSIERDNSLQNKKNRINRLHKLLTNNNEPAI